MHWFHYRITEKDTFFLVTVIDRFPLRMCIAFLMHRHKHCLKISFPRAPGWLSQRTNTCLTLDLNSDLDLSRVMSSSPGLGFMRSTEPTLKKEINNVLKFKESFFAHPSHLGGMKGCLYHGWLWSSTLGSLNRPA